MTHNACGSKHLDELDREAARGRTPQSTYILKALKAWLHDQIEPSNWASHWSHPHFRSFSTNQSVNLIVQFDRVTRTYQRDIRFILQNFTAKKKKEIDDFYTSNPY